MCFCVVATLVGGCQPRSRGEAAIVQAVRDNQADKVRAYLDAGGDPNAKDSRGDALIYIASGPKGGLAVTKVLLSGGADPRLGSAKGRSPLQNAASWCAPEIAAALIGAGADPRRRAENGKTALEVVCAAPQDRRRATLNVLGSFGGS